MFNAKSSELFHRRMPLGFLEQNVSLKDRNHMVRYYILFRVGNVFKIHSQLQPSRAFSGQGVILSGSPY